MEITRSSRIFFLTLAVGVIILTFLLIRPYLASVILALTLAVVLGPLHEFYSRHLGGRNGIATILTMVTSALAIVVPILVGIVLLTDSIAAFSTDLAQFEQTQGVLLEQRATNLLEWIRITFPTDRIPLTEAQLTAVVHDVVDQMEGRLARRMAEIGFSTFNLIAPFVIFYVMLGSILTNHERLIALVKSISPMDDTIDQLFLSRMAIMTKAMLKSILIAAVAQGLVLGLLMALTDTPHILPLTALAMILAILPYGAALVGVPVGLIHLFVGNTFEGVFILLGSLTFIAALDNQIRPLLVSKDAYLNRAFVFLSVFSGIALFGFMGVVYGPLIMILFSTTLEVYLEYYRVDTPNTLVESAGGSDGTGLVSEQE